MEMQKNLVKHKDVSYCKTDQIPQTTIECGFSATSDVPNPTGQSHWQPV